LPSFGQGRRPGPVEFQGKNINSDISGLPREKELVGTRREAEFAPKISKGGAELREGEEKGKKEGIAFQNLGGGGSLTSQRHKGLGKRGRGGSKREEIGGS